MNNNTVNTNIPQGIVSGESAESRFVDRQILAFRIVSVQKVKELFSVCFLWVSTLETLFSDNCYRPILKMYINSDINLLSFEGNFVTLHAVRHFRGNNLKLFFFGDYKIKLFFLICLTFFIYSLFRGNDF